MHDTNNGHNANDDGILSGLRVIDCGTYVAGPAAATVMSDFGAEVIKIERPGGGDLWRLFSKLPGTAKSELDWCWVLTSRNKKSVALDLGRPEGREALIRLVRTADVFLTNYQRTLLEKFRLTWEDLAPVNDRLIYAHLTGYGDTGDDADDPAFDALAYWARSGLMMSVTGTDGSPSAPRPGMGDHPTSMSLFGAIMLGLYRRERTGRGSRVSTSLLASGAWANACDIQAKLLNAKFPERGEGKHPPNPLTAAYLSRDGKIFLLVLIDPDNEFPRLCQAFGQPELGTGELFATNDGRDRNAAALYAILQSEFESRDLAEWRTIFKRQRHQMGAAARARRGREGSADARRRGVHQDGLSRRRRARDGEQPGLRRRQRKAETHCGGGGWRSHARGAAGTRLQRGRNRFDSASIVRDPARH